LVYKNSSDNLKLSMMEKLTSSQLTILQNHLIRAGSNDALLSELADHLACDVEHYMWKGLPFETALYKVLPEVNNKAVKYLRQTYQHETAMTGEQLQNASLDDIVFEFRNKAYGAYDLRRAYPGALKKAFFLGIGIFLMLMALLQGFSIGQWSFNSPQMLAWALGLSSVGYSIWVWYQESMVQGA
jgi:hypothetical protein